MKKIIVVGASAASIAFISKLRSFDQTSEIVCFSGETHIPYNRCFLADFLIDEQTEQQLQLKPQDFFEKNKIELRLNSWVTKIDTDHKQVHVSSQIFNYDYLFLGMGCRPFVPKFLQNSTTSGIFTFHTLSDMQNIKQFIQTSQPKTAVVIGAGLNGVEAVSALIDLKMSVTLVEAASTVLPGQVDSLVAGWVANKMEQAGALLMLGQKVVAVDHKNNQVVSVILDNGAVVPADMVVIAAGSVVNSELLHETGIELLHGSVVVDQHLKTNFEHVLAAGDLCLVPDMLSKQLTRSATWSDAMLQGLCAATSLSLTPRAYPGMLGLRDSYFFGVDFYACGKTIDHDQSVQVISFFEKTTLKKFYVQNDILIGFVLIGDISRLSEYKTSYMTKKTINLSSF